MVAASVGVEEMMLNVTQEIRVKASMAVTFAALLEQLGPGNVHPDGTAMRFKLEDWPGGRWFRDLGEGNGHWWGNVQAIKRPTLLELSGPLFMSYPVANNLQYRLKQDGDETVIEFRHQGFGLLEDAHRKGVVEGWKHMHEQVKKRAEAGR